MTGLPRPIFRVLLRPEPDVADPVQALKACLKAMLRTYGMRALEVVEVRPDVETGS